MNIYSPRLSVVIIAKNAEKIITRCLQSVVPIADEMIVVINDCTDETKIFAESYGAKVVEHRWEGFRDQKNFAIDIATYEWVLSLDADEAINEVLMTSIKNFISTTNNPYVAAKFARKTFFLNKWISYGDWYPDYSLRLFKKGHGRFVGGRVHERIEVDGKVRRIKGDILHYSGELPEEFINRNALYADLAARDLFEYKKKISPLGAAIKAQWTFFHSYILKLGFLDGSIGYFIARLKSFFTLYKYIRLLNFYEEAPLPENPNKSQS
ncbi:MAG: glycosyltransferase family 2 protein [Puniceicoccales bacterium]|jgi:glycosyltransferase involved in cell wall biosynthesis|nr:glycosyltransferase family 2 protein [Puniceicoccales bacterium]